MDHLLSILIAILGLLGLCYGESVMEYGAVGDGITDDTSIDGEMIAESDPKKWQKPENVWFIPWLIFSQVEGLVIAGRGLLDGQGKELQQACTNGSQNVTIKDLKITSPEASPNTDGVHITSSSAISITHSDIATGDDCVSIGDEVKNVNVTFLKCGPGHGVSVGSLGKGGSEVAVENIRVWHVNFTRTTNGARIKTWPGATGHARGIEFFDIRFDSVRNPIIIEQFYGCKTHCPNTTKGVHIDNVRYMNMSGTSTTKVAINFKCSGESVPCSNIFMKDIDISPANGIDSVSSNCTFAQGSVQGIIRPSSCL
ncbi:hypothetical protein AALP_AA2G253400 [Arabis alpina]|uniref:Polygalacturonase n=1 Tax=Arabis alpina TaxID=50452 RepID=A0A087HJW5_ARAAL|nr:hypothetical protein AALP_AA2G253400 [Arabis alpina]